MPVKLEKSYLDKFATVRTLTALNGVAKAAELTMGLFHYRAIVNAFVHGSPLEMSDIAHPLRTYQDTQAAMNDGVDKPLLGKFFRAGMTLGRQQDYAEARMVDGARINAAFDEKLGNLGWTGDRVIEAKNVLTSVVQSQHDFLFHDFIPTIKWLSAKREYLYQMEKNNYLGAKVTNS